MYGRNIRTPTGSECYGLYLSMSVLHLFKKVFRKKNFPKYFFKKFNFRSFFSKSFFLQNVFLEIAFSKICFLGIFFSEIPFRWFFSKIPFSTVLYFEISFLSFFVFFFEDFFVFFSKLWNFRFSLTFSTKFFFEHFSISKICFDICSPKIFDEKCSMKQFSVHLFRGKISQRFQKSHLDKYRSTLDGSPDSVTFFSEIRTHRYLTWWNPLSWAHFLYQNIFWSKSFFIEKQKRFFIENPKKTISNFFDLKKKWGQNSSKKLFGKSILKMKILKFRFFLMFFFFEKHCLFFDEKTFRSNIFWYIKCAQLSRSQIFQRFQKSYLENYSIYGTPMLHKTSENV